MGGGGGAVGGGGVAVGGAGEGRYRVREELFTGDGVHLIGRGREYLDVCVMFAVGVCQGAERWGVLDEEGLVYDGRVYVPVLLF